MLCSRGQDPQRHNPSLALQNLGARKRRNPCRKIPQKTAEKVRRDWEQGFQGGSVYLPFKLKCRKMFSPVSWPWGCYQTHQSFCQKETWQNDQVLPKIPQSQPQSRSIRALGCVEVETRNADGPACDLPWGSEQTPLWFLGPFVLSKLAWPWALEVTLIRIVLGYPYHLQRTLSP